MVNPIALDVLIPIILGAIALYFLFAPKAGALAHRPVLSEWRHRLFVIPAIGFYDGFFGPGAGSFYAAAARDCARQNPQFRQQSRRFPPVSGGRESRLDRRNRDDLRPGDRCLSRLARDDFDRSEAHKTDDRYHVFSS